MEQTADRIYIKDKDSRFVVVSKALAEMHGFENRHDLKGLTDFDLFTDEHARQAFDDEQAIIRTGKAMVNVVEKETWEDGSITWVCSNKAPLYLSSGQLVGTIGISRDITAERNTQKRLADSEKRLRKQNDIMRLDYKSAKEVQSVMIPGRVPDTEHINIAYLWKPMAVVGGDIINFPPNPDNAVLFFLGDVCGHGVTAAFYTVLIQYLTAHSAEIYPKDPDKFLDSVNEGLVGRIHLGFTTGLAGCFGTRQPDGSCRLVLSQAGHRQVFVYRKRDDITEIVDLSDGIVMGIPEMKASCIKTVDLDVGDRFYAFTDGIVEASDPEGEEYGVERITQTLQKLSARPLQETLDVLYEQVGRYTKVSDPQDDITLLGFEIT